MTKRQWGDPVICIIFSKPFVHNVPKRLFFCGGCHFVIIRSLLKNVLAQFIFDLCALKQGAFFCDLHPCVDSVATGREKTGAAIVQYICRSSLWVCELPRGKRPLQLPIQDQPFGRKVLHWVNLPGIEPCEPELHHDPRGGECLPLDQVGVFVRLCELGDDEPLQLLGWVTPVIWNLIALCQCWQWYGHLSVNWLDDKAVSSAACFVCCARTCFHRVWEGFTMYIKHVKKRKTSQ